MSDYISIISQAIGDGDDKRIVSVVEEALKSGVSATDILNKGLIPGIEALGVRFKDGEVFLPEILVSVRAMKKGVEHLNPYFGATKMQTLGTVVIGAIEEDMHDIGKNLVIIMLEASGFRVVDLGVDVPAASFVEAARRENADIIGVSALLTVTVRNVGKVIEVLKETGLKGQIRVMVGGAPVTREYADSIGAEGYGEDCVAAVDEAKRLMKLPKGS